MSDTYRLRGPRGPEYERARDTIAAVHAEWIKNPARLSFHERFAETTLLRLAGLEPAMTVVSLVDARLPDDRTSTLEAEVRELRSELAAARDYIELMRKATWPDGYELLVTEVEDLKAKNARLWAEIAELQGNDQ